jgi:hypothetical protein
MSKTSACVLFYCVSLLVDTPLCFNITLISTLLSFPASFFDESLLYSFFSHMRTIYNTHLLNWIFLKYANIWKSIALQLFSNTSLYTRPFGPGGHWLHLLLSECLPMYPSCFLALLTFTLKMETANSCETPRTHPSLT